MIEKSENNKNVFDKLDDLQEIIENKILENQNLLKLIHYNTSEPLEESDIDDPLSLVENDIYWYPIIAENVLSTTGVYLLCDFSMYKPAYQVDFANMNISFTILIHKHLRTVYDSHRRMNMILSELCDMFNRAMGDWLGDTEIVSFANMTTRKDYQASHITFRATQFNNKTCE